MLYSNTVSETLLLFWTPFTGPFYMITLIKSTIFPVLTSWSWRCSEEVQADHHTPTICRQLRLTWPRTPPSPTSSSPATCSSSRIPSALGQPSTRYVIWGGIFTQLRNMLWYPDTSTRPVICGGILTRTHGREIWGGTLARENGWSSAEIFLLEYADCHLWWYSYTSTRKINCECILKQLHGMWSVVVFLHENICGVIECKLL